MDLALGKLLRVKGGPGDREVKTFSAVVGLPAVVDRLKTDRLTDPHRQFVVLECEVAYYDQRGA